MGSRRFHRVEAGGLAVVDAWFPPGAVLARHTHDRTCVGIMLEGAFDVVFDGGPFPCTPGTVFTEPLGERHANRVSRAGAHVVVIQPDPARDDLFHPLRGLLDGIHLFRDAAMAGLARRLAREARSPDALAPLAAEAVALELLIGARRAQRGGDAAPAPGRWLARARDFVHDRFLDRLTIADVAAAAGVHPGHLCRAFRRQYHAGVASYLRRLRLEWAAAELVRSERPLSSIALAAGFADQSHFTRAFRAHVGLTPARFRRGPPPQRPAPTGSAAGTRSNVNPPARPTSTRTMSPSA
jgi:AraC family transcriptional regulator